MALGMRTQSEATRRAALSLGEEAGHGDIVGWAHEMRAWYALTQGNYRGRGGDHPGRSRSPQRRPGAGRRLRTPGAGRRAQVPAFTADGVARAGRRAVLALPRRPRDGRLPR